MRTFLRTFGLKRFPRTDFFKLATQKGNDLLLPTRQKTGGLTDFVLERTCPENYPKSAKNRASLANKATVTVSPKILQSLK